MQPPDFLHKDAETKLCEHFIAADAVCSLSTNSQQVLDAALRGKPTPLRVEPARVVEGDKPVNTAAFVIHSQIHASRPDVVAAAHAHSVYGKSWSALGRPLEPITQDVCAFFEDHAVFDDYTGVVLDLEEGKRIAHALGGNKAAILRNHGLLTVGHTVEEAAWWFITMERSCQAQLLASAAGTPVQISPEMARLTATQVGSHLAGWFSFQPLLDRISREQPDLFE